MNVWIHFNRKSMSKKTQHSKKKNGTQPTSVLLVVKGCESLPQKKEGGKLGNTLPNSSTAIAPPNIMEERLSPPNTESISLVFIVGQRADDLTAQSSPSEWTC